MALVPVQILRKSKYHRRLHVKPFHTANKATDSIVYDNGEENVHESTEQPKKNVKAKARRGEQKQLSSRSGSRLHERKCITTGDIANVQWRAVPMDDLRMHPNFVPLSLPEDVRLDSEADYRHLSFLPEGRTGRRPESELAAEIFEYIPKEII